jgi:hypothetical protein
MLSNSGDSGSEFWKLAPFVKIKRSQKLSMLTPVSEQEIGKCEKYSSSLRERLVSFGSWFADNIRPLAKILRERFGTAAYSR